MTWYKSNKIYKIYFNEFYEYIADKEGKVYTRIWNTSNTNYYSFA